jgi:uncharacterized protein
VIFCGKSHGIHPERLKHESGSKTAEAPDMMFSRKYPARIFERAREVVWPRGGLQRGWVYLWHRLKRLRHHPHSVAMGFAIGVFISFTPFLGLHLAFCVGMALFLRVSILASLIGQTVGNPATLPFIWLSSYQLGNVLLQRQGSVAASDMGSLLEKFFSLETVGSIFLPLLTGGFVLGALFAVLSYAGIYYAMTRMPSIGGKTHRV